MDVHLRALRYFVAVAEELSFTRAATERLYVSQPALSKQIRQLETLVRAELFTRGHRSIELTAAGEALLPGARRMLLEWEGAQAAVRSAADARDRTLTVGFHTRIGRGLIPAITAAMADLLPGWRLLFRQVSWDDPTAGLGNTSVDVAVAWLPVPDGEGLATKTITVEDRWVALPVGHRLSARPAVRMADLLDEPFIALPATAGSLRDFWLAGDARPTPPRIATEVSTADETFEAVAAGTGVALLSEGNVAIYRRDDVVAKRVIDLPPCELAVLWRARDRREAVKVFVDACCLCAASAATVA